MSEAVERLVDWAARLRLLRARADALTAAGGSPAAWSLAEAEAQFARLRTEARALFEAAARTYGDRCPEGYPVIDDNEIIGPGGSVGVRFSPWHAFFAAFEHAKKPKKAEPKPAGLAGALDIRVKRMPGDPLPPRDPDERFELALLGLRWDEDRGWVEVRRPLPETWSHETIAELFEAYLVGFNYDVAAGLPSGPAAR